MKLIRKFQSKKNETLEKEFESTNNVELFFSMEKSVEDISYWKIENINKIIKNINSLEDITFYFSKYSKSVKHLVNSLNISFEYDLVKLSDEVEQAIATGNRNKIESLIGYENNIDVIYAMILCVVKNLEWDKIKVSALENALNTVRPTELKNHLFLLLPLLKDNEEL